LGVTAILTELAGSMKLPSYMIPNRKTAWDAAAYGTNIRVSNKGKKAQWNDERLVTRCLEQVKSIVEKMRNDCAGGIKSHLTVDVSSAIHTTNTDLVVIIWREDLIITCSSE
jgi:hypothetical protein